MRLGAVDSEVVGVIRIGHEPAVRVLFRRPEEYRALVLQQLPGLALDTLYSAVVVKCQVVPGSATEREENLISGRLPAPVMGAPDFLPESPVTDSNRAPFPYEGNALPNELTGRRPPAPGDPSSVPEPRPRRVVAGTGRTPAGGNPKSGRLKDLAAHLRWA